MIEMTPGAKQDTFRYAVQSFFFLIRKPGQREHKFTAGELATAIRKHYDTANPKTNYIVQFLEHYRDTKITVGGWD